MKKIILLILPLLLFISFSNASHIVGGDISVAWVGPGQNDFQIKVRILRSCAAASAGMPTTATVRVHDLVTYALTQQFSITNPTITPNLPFGDPCWTPAGLCVDLGEFVQNVTIPNNPNGYFLEYQICCRNAGITNLANPSSEGMTFYCEIPDPGNIATLANSSPDMGPIPLDAYLCVNTSKNFQFNVTDADGDSLVYSLVTPIDDGPANPAPAFPYNDVTWAAGYSLANIVGGTSPMVIDQNTGVMTAAPSLIGTFAFGVRVEEYRNGVKIGETRRDAQYESLNCPVVGTIVNTVTISGDTMTAVQDSVFYQWLDCNNGYAIIPGATNQSFVPSVSGNYAVQVSNCAYTDTSICASLFLTGINEETSSSFTFAPNPVKDILTIKTINYQFDQIIIIDVMGKTIKTYTSEVKSIDVSSLSKGLYFLQVYSKEGITNNRFIKE